jgi:hypothetical protein
MAKVKSKGTILKQSIASVLTAVAQLTDISYSGGEVETFDATTLDGSVGKAYSQTGYAEGGEFQISGFFDPALAGHQAITDIILAPANCDWSVTFADAAPTTWTFTTAGVSFEFTVAMADGLKFSSTLKVTGLPAYAT